MTAVLERKADRTPSGTQVSERRCLACGELKPRDQLIRFVIGPEQQVIADLSENLPGHGLWVSADAHSITLAAKKNLFAKAAKEPAKPAADLAAMTVKLMRQRCLSFLGLAKGAGVTILGEQQTEAALRAGKVKLYLVASDAAKPLDNRHEAEICAIFTRDELGAALGYDQIVHAGLMPHGLTEKLRLELGRLESLMKNQDGDISQTESEAPSPAKTKTCQEGQA